jgi:hypothetical protein
MKELELIDKFLSEGRLYAAKGDPIQASEKLYKVVEECLKLLAEKEGIEEYKEAQREGRWWTGLLARSASTLSIRLKHREIGEAWAKAYNLHVWGFHEKALDVEHIEPDIIYIERLVNYVKNYIKLVK